MKLSVVGYPRVGASRELKYATEKYFKGIISEEALQAVAFELKKSHWEKQLNSNVDYIASNDFSFYDQVLDLCVLLNVVPKRFKNLGLDGLDTYFAMARGYQGEQGDVKALSMKKWFNTNYHYMVPEIESDTSIALVGDQPFRAYQEAKAFGIETKPVIIGAFTFLKLARLSEGESSERYIEDTINAYCEIVEHLSALGTEWVQLDEPALVRDLTSEDIALFERIYTAVLDRKNKTKVLLQTYFGDIRDAYEEIIQLPFDGVGLDFIEGNQTLELIEKYGFPEHKKLFAGVVNGKNIWRNDYKKTIELIEKIKTKVKDVVIGTSCSLVHVPYTTKSEQRLAEDYLKQFAFAEEKLEELSALKFIFLSDDRLKDKVYLENQKLFNEDRDCHNRQVQGLVAELSESDFVRYPSFGERETIQKGQLALPQLPTTTIGSFPQTKEVKANRSKFKKGEKSLEDYTAFNREKIAECIALQEEIGLDVLVHGEFERNDMVEYFGEHLEGYVFTEKAWVQSYGTRCVKPPIVWGDISRAEAMTVDYACYAQSLTKKYVKGMLTGPVTILNWSFPREDLSLKDCVFQIALAIKEEVLDLEANGIKIIQIDEAALREKLPLRKSDWHSEYLDWAIPAFRIVHSKVKPDTQIHTHMCYSEFSDIIKEIDAMDADVITFEAARSDLGLIETLNESGFVTEVGPGVYDIHSPRVPSVEEIEGILTKMLDKIPLKKLWVNPDCGLKTRGNEETVRSLKNMVIATKRTRSM